MSSHQEWRSAFVHEIRFSKSVISIARFQVGFDFSWEICSALVCEATVDASKWIRRGLDVYDS